MTVHLKICLCIINGVLLGVAVIFGHLVQNKYDRQERNHSRHLAVMQILVGVAGVYRYERRGRLEKGIM